jgi:hypothetical protein
MTCRDEILDCVDQIIKNSGNNQFQISDVMQCMKAIGTQYKESTIRTHIVSRMCKNAPKNHAVKYNDFERIDFGKYRLIK